MDTLWKPLRKPFGNPLGNPSLGNLFDPPRSLLGHLGHTRICVVSSSLCASSLAQSLDIMRAKAVRLREICHYINEHYDVESVCKSFPRRLEMLVEKKDRINK